MKKEKTVMHPFWKFLLLGLLCGAVIVGIILLVDPFAEDTYEGTGFKTPEAAVTGYLEALRNCDTEAMQKTFAIETMMKNIDMAAYWSYNRYYYDSTYGNDTLLPTDFSFGYDLMVENRRASLSNCIVSPFFMAAEGAFGDLKAYTDNAVTGFNSYSEDEIEDYMDSHRRSDYAPVLNSIEIHDIYEYLEGVTVSERQYEAYAQYEESMAKIYGADEYQCYVVELEIDGNDCYFGMTVVCYDGVWYNAQCCAHSVGRHQCGGFDYEI